MKTPLVLALAIALFMPLHAARQHGGNAKSNRNPQEAFRKRDQDGDGFLSRDEFTAKAKSPSKATTAFTKKDKDADGKLSSAEFTAGGKHNKGKAHKKPGKRGNKGRHVQTDGSQSA